MFKCIEPEVAGGQALIPDLDSQAKGPRRLVVTIVSARHLPRMDFFGSIDPYCNLHFIGFEYQTSIIKNNYSPDWGDSYFFDVDDVGQQPGKLRVALYDWDRIKSNDYVGEVEIPAMRMWSVMRAPIGWEEERDWQITNAGKAVIGQDKQVATVTIRLQVLEVEQEDIPIEIDPSMRGPRSLEVTIVSARHLPKKDILGSIDPFCIVEFIGLEFETTTLINNYSPDWDESFAFEMQDVQMQPGPLHITVMDWDRLSSNDKVGDIFIPPERMWDVVRAPPYWVEERAFALTLGGQAVVGFDKHTSVLTLRLRVLEPESASRESLLCAAGPPVRHDSVQLYSADGAAVRRGGTITKYLEQSKRARGKIKTILSVQGIARSIVSGKKRRFTEAGHDLDLTYITPRIIAMGYPSGGLLESNYRNSMGDVYRFFQQRHALHYLIVNLCSEREYNFDTFHGACVRYPFPDHNPPALELLLPCCAFIHRFLQRDDANVVAVHCKAGKGRTGLVVVCYLLFCGLKSTARSARCLYDWTRTKDGKGLTIISQIRYAHYFEQLLREIHAGEEAAPETAEDRAQAAALLRLRIHTIPRFDASGCNPTFVVSVKAAADHREYPIFRSDAPRAPGERWLSEQTDEFGRTSSDRPNSCAGGAVSRAGARRGEARPSRWDLFPESRAGGAVRVAGDFHVTFYNLRRGCATVDSKRMFHFWLHTGMLARPPADMCGRARALPAAECEAEGLPHGAWSLTLSKHEIDKAAGDRRCARFDADFCVELFWAPLPGQIGAGAALEAARGVALAGRPASYQSFGSAASSSSSGGASGGDAPLAAEREGYQRAVHERVGSGRPPPTFEEWVLGRCDDAPPPPAPPTPGFVPQPQPPPAPPSMDSLDLSSAGARARAGGGGGVQDYEEADEDDDNDEYDDSPDPTSGVGSALSALTSGVGSARSADSSQRSGSIRSGSVRSGSFRPGAGGAAAAAAAVAARVSARSYSMR